MLVSICTPTFNRRPFINNMIQCFKHQDYKGPMEWIIVDDGTDSIEDLILEANLPEIKYFRHTEKLTLGKKRNLMHSYSKGDIIVYMDDDDYYPPERVSHAVERLQSSPVALCAGSSVLHIYFHHISKIVEFGPYGPNHATAGTFAFKRKLLDITSYDENAALGEEKSFLKNYTIPFIQLNPKKVILVFSHEHNTFDKRTLLVNPNPQVIKETNLKVTEFIKQPSILRFFMFDLHKSLVNYSPGEPSMKPDVLEYMKKIEFERNFVIQFGDKKFTGEQIVNQLNQQQAFIKQLMARISKQEDEIKNLNRQLNTVVKIV